VTSTELLLRPADQGDAAAIAEVHLAARADAVMPPSPHSDADVRSGIEGKLKGYDESWVAVSDDLVVGYVRLVGDWLEDLYVAPSHAGQGIGTALLDLVKSLRPDGFSLWVFEMNEPARRFYGNRGLVELQHTDGSANEEHAPDIRAAWPGEQPLLFLRGLVDELDAELAEVLERRAALTLTIQGFKPVGGPAGRDADREREIAEHMAEHAPRLGAERLQRIIHTVITESLDAAD